jgi:hypothetical protein
MRRDAAASVRDSHPWSLLIDDYVHETQHMMSDEHIERCFVMRESVDVTHNSTKDSIYIHHYFLINCFFWSSVTMYLVVR